MYFGFASDYGFILKENQSTESTDGNDVLWF